MAFMIKFIMTWVIWSASTAALTASICASKVIATCLDCAWLRNIAIVLAVNSVKSISANTGKRGRAASINVETSLFSRSVSALIKVSTSLPSSDSIFSRFSTSADERNIPSGVRTS